MKILIFFKNLFLKKREKKELFPVSNNSKFRYPLSSYVLNKNNPTILEKIPNHNFPSEILLAESLLETINEIFSQL